MTDTNTLTEALENLQAAQLACEKALEYIENHNIDEDAHADIRSELNKIKNDGAIYTNDQIEQIVEDGLKEHVEAELEEAHPKFKEYLHNFLIDDESIELIAFGALPLNELLMSANLLLTDYSSVAWDFYYQKKQNNCHF